MKQCWTFANLHERAGLTTLWENNQMQEAQPLLAERSLSEMEIEWPELRTKFRLGDTLVDKQ